MRWWLLFCPVFALAATPDLRVERLTVAGGAELLTVFGRFPDSQTSLLQSSEVPLLSVLRDTLGDNDPENDRLRYVWVLSSTQPNLLQRAAAALPFFYWRADPGKNANSRPVPVIDLASTSRGVWSQVAQSVTQTMALDPTGAVVRSSTRSYRNNVDDHRRANLVAGLAVLSQLENQPEAEALFSEPELIEIETRLSLAGKMMGGLVSSERLPAAYAKERMKTMEERGHNWELLRQHAEMNGLYFEPFGEDGASTHALLWVATEDLGRPRKFDPQFLNISDPYRDPRLRNWTGYRQVRDGQEMIPLALYGLEYPKVPLMLVDFRDTHNAKRREMIRRAATDTVSGVFGISRFTNWPYLVGSIGFNFVRTRHGATSDRSARLKAYSEVRQWMALDGSIDPGLRAEIQKRLEVNGVNPIGESIFNEAKIAQAQYTALLHYARDPNGLPAKIDRDRRAEAETYEHTATQRTEYRLATWFSFGKYHHHDPETEPVEARLDRERKLAHETQFLQVVARSGPQAEIVWNMDEVRHALDQIAASKIPARSALAVEKIMRQTTDEETRALCQRALQGLAVPGVETSGQ